MGVIYHLEDHAAVRDANQKAQMSMANRSNRQLNDTSVSKFRSSNQSYSSNVNNVTFNSSVNSGGDQLNHPFESETPH